MSESGRGAVVALVVSHDGARWLPVVIEGLRAQTRAPDRVVCVDTGSRDGSVELLEEAFGPVVPAPPTTGYPEAVRRGLAELAGPDAPEWIWLLHDDSTPDAGALEALLAAAEEHPEADVLGPKLREWPSLRRLLEVGVTISGTGRRETGLERGEYDQGQHDDVRRVLAVNTAGMLVRRRVLEALGGLDDHLPVFGNDLDLGWRAAAAGHTTLVVPSAVVFHAEAATRGLRRTALTGRHVHFQQRRAALFTLIANARPRSLPLQVVRLVLGTFLRVLGFLLVRSVSEALDELAALFSLAGSTGELRRARRERAQHTQAPPQEVRRLLAPPWLPYRHGLDAVGDVASAITDQASDVAERRRAAAAARDPAAYAASGAAGARRAVAEEDEVPDDTSFVARFLSDPVAVTAALVVVLAVLATRDAFGQVVGGALAPVPESVGAWWGLHLESWHALGQGTPVPAPAYLLPLTLVATLLGGGPGAAVSAVLLLAVPVALWGAWRFLRVTGRLAAVRGAPRWLLLWGAATYALVPVTSGAWGGGRLGPVVTTALLPWAAHAALGFVDPAPDRRWRAAWRVGLLLTLLVAFTPTAWLVAAAIGSVTVLVTSVLLRGAARDRSTWLPPVVALAVPLVLLAPWWVGSLRHDAAEALLLDPGRLPSAAPGGLDLLAGRLDSSGAPSVVGLLLVALAVLALVPRTTRLPVLLTWGVALLAALTTLALSWTTLDLPTGTAAPGVGAPLAVLVGALVVAVVLGGVGARASGETRDRTARSSTLSRAALVVLSVVAALVPVVGLGWGVLTDHGLGGDPGSGVPAYMVQSSELGPEHGILVLGGEVATGLEYTVRRGDGTTVGEDEVLALSGEDADLTATVRDLVSAPTPATVDRLGSLGIEYVVLPAPADGDVAARLDATGGLVQASAADRDTRAWQVGKDLSTEALGGGTSAVHVVALVVQGLGLILVLVLCAPTRERRRTA
ncbi:N-acetylglucosaminyl-diphospho-decaprenol L-rhamnosyltransferase [Nocardioides dokdonensis FR1436]|uniref:N-acetylglucosaminyl-diphospho-decaprenol L-rhamnosyltransferase n=1 Tax=Nocardioides dokdonensis FR1436 TaxID=1300347 RepID=A0A1A9GEE1_9ACTN|nr:glycosyltransferase family 2 protein [Nocardioides dokdonensis]ANH36604.1 N-acetylglucosaminyl-diphospho-decaprenol L-rhamnosyltransferase [Nocardioides dokdonensis FR1436]